MENKNHGIQSRVEETEKTDRNKPIVNLVKVQKIHRVGIFLVCIENTKSQVFKYDSLGCDGRKP